MTFTKATELPDVGAAASADRGTVRGTSAPYQAPVKHNGAARANNGSTTRRFAMTQLMWWLLRPVSCSQDTSYGKVSSFEAIRILSHPITISGLQFLVIHDSHAIAIHSIDIDWHRLQSTLTGKSNHITHAEKTSDIYLAAKVSCGLDV